MTVTYEVETMILHLAGRQGRSTAAIAAEVCPRTGLSQATVRRIIARQHREISEPQDDGGQPAPGRPR